MVRPYPLYLIFLESKTVSIFHEAKCQALDRADLIKVVDTSCVIHCTCCTNNPQMVRLGLIVMEYQIDSTVVVPHSSRNRSQTPLHRKCVLGIHVQAHSASYTMCIEGTPCSTPRTSSRAGSRVWRSCGMAGVIQGAVAWERGSTPAANSSVLSTEVFPT